MAVTDLTTPQEVAARAEAAERRVAQSEFADQLNSVFVLHAAPDLTVPVELIGLSAQPSVAGYEQFSLVFRAPLDMAPVQRTYDMEHPVLGGLHLFLVPVRRDADGIYLEAVFNRLLAPQFVEG